MTGTPVANCTTMKKTTTMPTNAFENLHISMVTRAAPSANYRGENDGSKSQLQKLRLHGSERIVVSADAIRNRVREKLAEHGLPVNRSRVHDATQLTVQFGEVPNADRFADDFVMGYLITDHATAVKAGVPPRRPSPLHMNYAVACSPYCDTTTMHQSPANSEDSAWRNAATSAVLTREVDFVRFALPMTLVGREFKSSDMGRSSARTLLTILGDLDGVAGGHARTRFDFSAASFIARVTRRSTPGFDSYPFDAQGECEGLIRDLLNAADSGLRPAEFILSGEIVRNMDPATKEALQRLFVALEPSVDNGLLHAADAFVGPVE